MRDLATGATTLVDRTAGGGAPSDGAGGPAISADGTKVTFISRSPDIPGAPPDGNEHVYEGRPGHGDVTLIDRTTGGTVAGPSGPATTFANSPSMSADGSRLSFTSNAPNLPAATPGFSKVFVRDLASGTTVLGSNRDGGARGGRFGADDGALSGNGACVVFDSFSDDLLAGGYDSDFKHHFDACLSPASLTR